ncbi:MAG: class I SAM-dependent methyltransferase [Leptolyngbyaceae bacterium]|nr:class I SAM-dependent methyltransferase [Leptolyngbyaceae bacterium]
MIIVTRLLILCCLTLSYWGFGGIPGISPAIHAKVLALTVERPIALDLSWGLTDAPTAGLSSPYGYRDRPSSDGIGKTYMGREIAQVMGYPGAAWLERPSRMQSEKPHLLIANLDIQARDVIADIGAGTGYLSVRLAAQVPDGQVLAVDVQPEMIALLRQRIEAQQLDNIEPILALDGDPQLPEGSIDMAIMVDVYHELAYPYEVMRKVVRALRPGGKVVLVEYRGENPLIPIKRLHKMTERQVRREMAAVGLTWVTTNEDLPKQHIIVFTKKDSVAG